MYKVIIFLVKQVVDLSGIPIFYQREEVPSYYQLCTVKNSFGAKFIRYCFVNAC